MREEIGPRGRITNAQAARRAGRRGPWQWLVAPAALLLAVIAWPGAALGQGKEPSKAEALFTEGRAALKGGDYETACAKFTESFKLSGAVGALLNLAECEEKRGRLATALGHWKQGAEWLSISPNDNRLPIAREHITSLDKRVPTLVVTLAPGAPPDTLVRVDGAVIERLPSPPMPLNPGARELMILAPGHEQRRVTVTLVEGRREEVAVTPGDKTAAPPPPPERGGTQRTVGFVVGGVGVLGLVAGGVTGGIMLGLKSTVDSECDERKTCTQAGHDAAETGKSLVVPNAVAFALGAAGVGAGLVLILTSGGSKAEATGVGVHPLPGGAGLSLRKTF